jgi:hypothetical protein
VVNGGQVQIGRGAGVWLDEPQTTESVVKQVRGWANVEAADVDDSPMTTGQVGSTVPLPVGLLSVGQATPRSGDHLLALPSGSSLVVSYQQPSGAVLTATIRWP